MSIEYETVRCENGETVPKDDYSGYYGCGGYAIRGPEDEQLAGRMDALLENADRTERDHATAIYKRVLERRNRLAECDDGALAVISGMVEEYLLDVRARNIEYFYGDIAHLIQHLEPDDISRQVED